MSHLPRISEAEWEVMKALWQRSPQTANELAETESFLDRVFNGSLNLMWTKVSGPGLRHLKAAANLTELNLRASAVVNAGLANLQHLPNLEILHLGQSSNEGEGRSYAQTIIKLLEGCARPKALPGLVGILEDKNQMKRRISMIAKFKKVRGLSALALLLIAGLGLVALTDAQDKKLSDTDKLIEEIRKLAGKVTFADNKATGSVVGVTFDAYDEYREDYLKTPEFNDGLLAQVSQFSDLRELNIPGTAVTDKGLVSLKNLKHLEQIKALRDLRRLNLPVAEITDEGLKSLQHFGELEMLNLNLNP